MTTALRQRLQQLGGLPAASGGVDRAMAADAPGARSGRGGPSARSWAAAGFREETPGLLVRRVRAPMAAGAPLLASTLALLSGDPRWAEPGEGAVWLFDVETTGLAGGTGTVPFLYGWARLDGPPSGGGWAAGPEAGLEVEQWLLPELGSEEPIIRAAVARLRGARGIVTYNGRTFDLPLVRTRTVLARVSGLWPDPPHLDLLHPTRRLFRHRLDRCTLTTASAVLVGTRRGADLPGWEVPERYRTFLRCGDPAVLGSVLSHNVADLAELGGLLWHLASHVEGGIGEPQDAYPLGRFYEARGCTEAALRSYGTAVVLAPPPLDRAALGRRARLLRRQGRLDEAATLWELGWRRWEDMEAAEALAIDREWRGRDLEEALALSRAALARASGPWASRFARRVWRLERRLSRSQAPEAAGADPGRPAPWASWLPGGVSYEAWQLLRQRRGSRPRAGPWGMGTTAAGT